MVRPYIREAVNKTIVQWTWLKNHPRRLRKDFFYEFGIDKVDEPKYGCYLCNIWLQESEGRCLQREMTRCPLDEEDTQCFNEESPYELWCDGIKKKEQAIKIVEACRRWLRTVDE